MLPTVCIMDRKHGPVQPELIDREYPGGFWTNFNKSCEAFQTTHVWVRRADWRKAAGFGGSAGIQGCQNRDVQCESEWHKH